MVATIVRGLAADMAAAGLTQTALARLASVRVETVNRTLNGKTAPDTATLAKLDSAIRAAMVGRTTPRNRAASGENASKTGTSAGYR